MPKKLSQEEVVRRFREVHFGYYDYSKVVYVNDRTKVCIICPIHGEFLQEPQAHYRQRCGCPICGIDVTARKRNMGTDKFIEKSRRVHGDKYDYSKVVYIKSKEKVCIICKKCGKEFWQRPNAHLRGHGCPACSKTVIGDKSRKDTESFIRRARAVHGDRYIYDKSVYVSNHKKITITCRKHGDFEQSPSNHTHGSGCPICKAELLSKCQRSNTAEFVSKAKKIHGDEFDYSLVEYVRKDKKVKIKCNRCGKVFEQTPNSHLCGTGCPHCNSSKGEARIERFLLDNGVYFVKQHRIQPNDLFCKTKTFKVDFFLPHINTIIEFNGEQHYVPIEHFGGERKFQKQHERDMVLRQYCKDNKIKLIEIPYTKFNSIELILTNKLNKHGEKKRNKSTIRKAN